MENTSQTERIKERIFLCFAEGGFYPVTALDESVKSYEQQAKDTGEINDHIIRIENANGRVLWERWPDEVS